MKQIYALGLWRKAARVVSAKIARATKILCWASVAMWAAGAGAQIVQPESLESEFIPTTVRIEKAVVPGHLRLNAADDAVFEELYQSVSDTHPQHPGVLAQIPEEKRKVFLAWFLPASRAGAGAEKAKAEIILEFDGATVQSLIEKVAKARGMVAVRYFYGWVMLPQGLALPKKEDVVEMKDFRKDPVRLCLFPTRDEAMRMLGGGDKEVLDFLNLCLRVNQFHESVQFKIKALSAEERRDVKELKDAEDRKLAMWCRGHIRFLELLHLYGIGFQRRFVWGEPEVLCEMKWP